MAGPHNEPGTTHGRPWRPSPEGSSGKGADALLAVLAVIVIMMIRRNDFIAIGAGLAVAAGARLAGL